MKIVIHWIFSALAVLIAAYLLPGVFIESIFAAFVVAVVIGILNAIIRPVLVIFTLPISILTLGLFIFVINAFLILLAGRLVPGFHVAGFGSAFLFSLVLSLVGWILHSFEKEEGE